MLCKLPSFIPKNIYSYSSIQIFNLSFIFNTQQWRGKHIKEKRLIDDVKNDVHQKNPTSKSHSKVYNKSNLLPVTTSYEIRSNKDKQVNESKETKKYRCLLDNVSDIITAVNIWGEILYINKSTERVFGRKPKEVIGKNFLNSNLFKIKNITNVAEIFEKVVQGKKLERFEVEVTHKDGHYIPLELSIKTLKKKGKVNEIYFVARDISERVKAQKEVVESKIFLDSIFNSMSDMISIQDTNFNIIKVNQAFLDYFQMPLDDIIGKKCYEIIHETNEPYPKCPHAQLLKTQQCCTSEFFESKLGLFIEASASPILTSNGELNGSVHVIKNITDRKKTEEQLKESKQRFQDVVFSSNDWIWEIDNKGRYSYASGRVKDLLGHTSEELIGKTPFQLMPDKEAERISTIFEEVRRKKENIIDLENWNISKEGNLVCLLTNGVPILDDAGNLLGYRGVDKDITKRKKIEQQLQKAHNELSLLNRDLEKRVKQRTSELAGEIEKNNKARDEIEKIYNYLQTVIDSTTHLIMVLDNQNRVTIWNRSAEKLTGYSRKEIIGRYITKLEVFQEPQQLVDHFTKLKMDNKGFTDNIILNTKFGEMLVINFSVASISMKQKQVSGLIYVGSDITLELESHQKIIPGNCYLYKKGDIIAGIDLFFNLLKSDDKGLLITRYNIDLLRKIREKPNIKTCLLKNEVDDVFDSVADLNALFEVICGFVKEHGSGVVFLDRLDYLLCRFSSRAVMEFVYEVVDVVRGSGLVLLVYVDPVVIERGDLVLLESELLVFPSQRVDEIEMGEELYAILDFLAEQERQKCVVTVSSFLKHFSFSRTTARKRIALLEQQGLVVLKKRGRDMYVHLTMKGKNLLNSRLIIS